MIIDIFTKQVLYVHNALSDLETHVYRLGDTLKAKFGDNVNRLVDDCYDIVNKDTLHLDTYNHGDVHNSSHDVNYVNRDIKRWNTPHPMPSNPAVIDRLASTIGLRHVVLGYKSDAFMWMDHKYKLTQYALTRLRTNTRSFDIYTRSDLVAHDDYIALLDNTKDRIFIYIPAHRNEEKSRIEEPGAPSVARRLVAVAKLESLGFQVSVVNTRVKRRSVKRKVG